MTKIQNSKFKIQNFIIPPILLLAIIFLFSCTSSTEVSKGSLIGSVALENETDHSGISVSLYELAYLDTTITRINNEYPHIGVIINQHTEFDHRFQTPIKTGTTAADGSFELKNIPTGTYNFVAQKAGYGFRYLLEVEISKGENLLSEELKIKNVKSKMKKPVISTGMEKSNSSRGTLSNNSKLRIQNSTLTLFPELHLSGEISEEIVVEPYHHLVCDDDVTFVPGSRLEIQPNAVVRIAPGADLTIMGNFKAQGEEDNMFWVTTNDGFADDSNLKLKKKNVKLDSSNEPERNDNFTSSILNFTFNRDSDLGLYNSMQLSPLATVEDDLIEWGKWDWGNTCLLNKVNNVTMQNGIFRNGGSGYKNYITDSNIACNLNTQNLNSPNYGGIFFENTNNGQINNNIVINCSNGIKDKEGNDGFIENNYVANAFNCIALSYSNDYNVSHNNMQSNENGIYCANSSSALINNNQICADSTIVIYKLYFSNIEIEYNNLKYLKNSISLTYNIYNDVIAKNNFFYTVESMQILNSIYDKNAPDAEDYYIFGEVLYEPFLINELTNVGIQ